MGASTSNLATVLRLKSKGIKDLNDLKQPHLLPVFTKLQVILLQKNKISQIPSEIAKDIPKSPKLIEHLQEVNLSSNRLTSLPDEFFLLVNLQKLYLQNNAFTEFPRGILSFYCLAELTIHKNQIKKIPWDIHRLRSLKLFDITNNQLQFLPTTLGKMTTLEDLRPVPNPLVYEEELTQVLMAALSTDDSMTCIREFLDRKEVPAIYRADKEEEEKKLMEDQSKLTADGRLLWKLLRDHEAFGALKAHMQKEHNHENLLFWRQIRRFTQRYYSDREITCQALITDATTIFKDYIAEDSKYTINISAAVMEKLRAIFTDPFHFPAGINQWVFNEAFDQSFALMERDMFRRFKATDEAKEILKRLEAQNVTVAQTY